VHWVRRLFDHLTYANVAATLALLLALGGASYAAVTLPPGSVGTSQLRAGAVTPRALSFPLGAATIEDTAPLSLEKSPCNAPVPVGGGAGTKPPCNAAAERRETTPGRETVIHLARRTNTIVTALAGLNDSQPPGTSANVGLQIVIDNTVAGASTTTVVGGQAAQAPAQVISPLSAGSHTLRIRVVAQYSSPAAGAVTVAPMSLVASVLPPI
jgi:hypothetical protein